MQKGFENIENEQEIFGGEEGEFMEERIVMPGFKEHRFHWAGKYDRERKSKESLFLTCPTLKISHFLYEAQ